MESLKTYVVIKTVTDSTGHMDVSVVDLFSTNNAGESAERQARALADRLNRRKNIAPMEAYIVRVVGEESDTIL